MAEKPYYFETGEDGIRYEVDRKTGKRTPLDDLVRQYAEEGKLKTMEQQMADEHYKKKSKKKDIDRIEEV